MKTIKKISMAIVLFSLFTATAFGADTDQQRSRDRHQGPPPEAFTACEGKNAGDTAEFFSPHGDTVTGICELHGDRLVLRPDNPPPEGRERDKDKD